MCVMLAVPGRASGDGPRCAARRSVTASTSTDAHDGPRTDPGRTDHRARATGRDLLRDRPLPGLGVTGGRSWTRLEGPSCGHRARAGVGVQRRDRGRTPGVCPPWAALGRRPRPLTSRRPTSASSRRPGTSSTASTSAPDKLNDNDAHLRRHQRHDRSGRRHRPHLVPDPRAARPARRTTCPASTSGSASGSTSRRTACRWSSASSRAARPRRPGSTRVTRSSRSMATRPPARPLDDVVGWVRGEAGTTVNVTRPPGCRRQDARPVRSRAPTSRSCRSPGRWSPGRTRR